MIKVLVYCVFAVAAAGCKHTAKAPSIVDPHVPCANRNPDRNVYFGDLHVHTSYSFDASAFDVRTTPPDAYRFARGETVALPPFDPSAPDGGGRQLHLDRPLDFAAVTDHSEYLAEVQLCRTPGSSAYDTTACTNYRAGGNSAVVPFGFPLTADDPERFGAICGDHDSACISELATAWAAEQAAAEAAYDRTAECKFTTFVAYEYTAATRLSTLHRNVIFKDKTVPLPISYFEAPSPNELWTSLETECIDAGTGCDALVIPHNPNESNGNMFAIEYPGATKINDQKKAAERRARREPLVEIYQHKAASECFNGLSGVLGAPDEQCEFEKPRRADFVDCGDGTGQGGVTRLGCFSRLDFVRNVLAYGLLESQRIGANPYRLGIIASTDTHNGTPGAVDDREFIGHRGLDDDTTALRLGGGSLTPGGIEFSAGGLAAVWAEENSRESIFAALSRREVYGTSGPRMAVRFFGSWQNGATCTDPAMIETAYKTSVPMGATLPKRNGNAPTFLVSALRDPGTDRRPSVGLERLQIIKGWIDNGTPRVEVYDVKVQDEPLATVDATTCEPAGAAAATLCTAWTDPSFDPKVPAYYYARVLEAPTCRWSTYTCNALAPTNTRPPSCDDPAIPKTIQERAWTSPIWYEPN